MGQFELFQGDGDWLQRLCDLVLAFSSAAASPPNVLPLFTEHRDLAPQSLVHI